MLFHIGHVALYMKLQREMYLCTGRERIRGTHFAHGAVTALLWRGITSGAMKN
jgi:hypothetical protein